MSLEYSPIAKGVVECYDENNNLLFIRNNMIVKTGRSYILRSLFGNEKIGTIYALVSRDSSVTTPDMTYADVNISDMVVGTGTEVEPPVLTYDTDISARLTITKAANSNSSENISSLALYFKDSDTPTLFSRVVFPPYPDSATLKFTYKIYF